jgi:hypothetical protein
MAVWPELGNEVVDLGNEVAKLLESYKKKPFVSKRIALPMPAINERPEFSLREDDEDEIDDVWEFYYQENGRNVKKLWPCQELEYYEEIRVIDNDIFIKFKSQAPE